MSVTFFTSNFDGSVIPVYTNSHATNIGIKLFINEQPIRFYQAYPSRTIADAQLSAQVVQYGGIPTAGYFSASVFIQLTNP